MIKLKDILSEAYTPTVTIEFTRENRGKGKEVVEKFKSEKDAKKYIRKMVKKYKLKKQRGFWGNPVDGIELRQNFSQEDEMKLNDIVKQIQEDWWSKLEPDEQAAYIKAHPKSKKAQQAKQKAKDSKDKKPKPILSQSS